MELGIIIVQTEKDKTQRVNRVKRKYGEPQPQSKSICLTRHLIEVFFSDVIHFLLFQGDTLLEGAEED